ncbi:LysR family transcriptional regulator [Paenarthrobacter sp. RAF54_2]|uniref:LysR family transcriptional regulator n=1 Tax=Paenarthrobacter sp. RAF54_2 TaxID=3233061 RepID=UPI003F967780
MDSRSLAYFLAVAETGSVSSAAQSCFVSQPAVSRQIAALEREVGLKLFRRTVSGMQLTPAGERLRTMAKDIQIRVERAGHAMAAMRAGRQTFTVACPETTGNYFIAPYMASGAPISEIVPVRPAAVYDQLAEGADLAVNTSPPPPGLAAQELLSFGILIQSPDPKWLRSKAKNGIELAAMGQEAVLVPGYGSAVERIVKRAALEAELTLEGLRITTNGTVAQALAAAGQGSALVIEHPRFGLHGVPLLHNGKALQISLYAGWEPDHYAAEELSGLASHMSAWTRQHWQKSRGGTLYT